MSPAWSESGGSLRMCLGPTSLVRSWVNAVEMWGKPKQPLHIPKYIDKEHCLVRCSENATIILDVACWSRLWDLTSELGWRLCLVCKCSAKHWVTMMKDSTHATCVMLDLCKQSDSCIDHILQKNWKELHLLEIGAAELVTMLSNSQIEVLPNLKNISPADCYCAQ